MKPPELGTKSQPFPRTRPEITVAPSQAKPFVVESRRMPGFGVPLEVGAMAWMAWYDPPDWRLTSVTYERVVRPAEVHGLDGVEIEMLDWDAAEPVWQPYYTHFVRLTDEAIQWLASSHVRDGKRILYTLLDEGFENDWGHLPRRLEDTGRLIANDDGTFTLGPPAGEMVHDVFGAGVFRVGVDGQTYTCLRVLDVKTYPAEKGVLEREILSECYYTQSDELILFRRYNGRLWATRGKSTYAGPPWDKRLPDNARLVINGAVFVHWYDCLTDTTCLPGAPRRRSKRKA